MTWDPENNPITASQLPLRIGFRDSATFGNFLAGPNLQVVDSLRMGRDITLYIWGGPGTGKTHLLHATCHWCVEQGGQPIYLSLGQAAALAPAVLDGLEESALVCLDDLEGVAGNTAWETALFHLYNKLREAGVPLVVAAAAPPAGLGIGLPDLRSRLTWGPVFQLHPLSDEEKVEALKQRLSARGLELPPEVAAYLLRRFPRDMHTLFQLAERLDAASLAAKRRLTVPFVRDCLSGQ